MKKLSLKTKLVIFTSPLVCLLMTLLIIYNIKFNAEGYDILLRNRFTGLGWGVYFCNKKENCMEDHKSPFEIWGFAHTIDGGQAECRFYPPIKDLPSPY